MDISSEAIAKNDQTKAAMKAAVFAALSEMPADAREEIVIAVHDHLELCNSIRPTGSSTYVLKHALGLGMNEFQDWIVEWKNSQE